MRPIRSAAKAVIIMDRRILAVRLSDATVDWYVLPGGGQEPGETLHEALRRECREEIGAEIEIGPLRFVREYIGRNHEFAREDADQHQIDHFFECALADPGAALRSTVPDLGQTGIQWLDLSDLLRCTLYPLALRPLLVEVPAKQGPVYMGDIN